MTKELKFERDDYATRLISFQKEHDKLPITIMRNDVKLVFVLDEKEIQELKEFLNNDI